MWVECSHNLLLKTTLTFWLAQFFYLESIEPLQDSQLLVTFLAATQFIPMNGGFLLIQSSTQQFMLSNALASPLNASDANLGTQSKREASQYGFTSEPRRL